ncbi:MAG: hypothetical protein PHY72_00010 [Candidatus Pacebacteria bacterium]|nr:hypothetical protein [Candidatus Paceibacterota bacterium]
MFKWVGKGLKGFHNFFRVNGKVGKMVGRIIEVIVVVFMLCTIVTAFYVFGLVPTKNLLTGIKNFAVDKFSKEKPSQVTEIVVLPQNQQSQKASQLPQRKIVVETKQMVSAVPLTIATKPKEENKKQVVVAEKKEVSFITPAVYESRVGKVSQGLAKTQWNQNPSINRLWGTPIVAEKVVGTLHQQPEQLQVNVPVSNAEENAIAVLAQADEVLKKGVLETKTETVKNIKPDASALAKVEELGKKFDEEQCQKVVQGKKETIDSAETKVEAGKVQKRQKISYFMGTVIAYGEEKKEEKEK